RAYCLCLMILPLPSSTLFPYTTLFRSRLDSFYDGPMWNGWGWYGPWAWGPPMGYRTQVTTYTVGTLVVDMFDARTKRAVWSAVAEDTVPDTPAKINADIDAAVAKMFLDFPPGRLPPG